MISQSENGAGDVNCTQIPERDKIHYEAFRELLYKLDINPYEFYKINSEKLKGWYPDLPERKGTVNIKDLSTLIWGEKNGK